LRRPAFWKGATLRAGMFEEREDRGIGGGPDFTVRDSGAEREDRMTHRPSPGRVALLTAIVLLFGTIGFVLYRDVILNGPFLFDDFEYILGNPMIKSLAYFTNIADPRYLGYFSFAVNYGLDGEDPFGFHLVNVTIHVMNALLVFGVWKTVLNLLSSGDDRTPGGHSAVAFFAALIFLVHPIETQAVSYITQRFTSLSALFYLLSVLLYLHARVRLEKGSGERKRGYAIYILSVVFAVFAMKTKEIAFTIPFMVAILEFLLFEKSQYGKRRFYFLIPFAAMLIIIPLSLFGPEWGLSARGSGIDEATRRDKLYDLSRRSPYEYLVTQFRVIVTYIRLLVFPVRQLAVYDYPASHSLFEPRVLLSLAFLLGIAGAARHSWRKARKADFREAPYYRLLSIGILWFFVTISVESSVIPIKDIIFEHRLYLPSAGFFASCAGLFMLIAARFRHFVSGRAAAAVGAVSVIAALSVATYTRNAVWTDEVGFWNDVVQKTGKAIGYNNRGNAYLKKGEYALALRDLDRTIGFFPRARDIMAWENSDFTPSNMAKTYISRGQVYEQLGDPLRAQEDFETANRIMKMPPGHVPELTGPSGDVQGRME
jgi:tetratricopeptide (TPR) repeat protein